MKRKTTQRWAGALLALVLSLALCPAALADTDGAEPKITQQPDQLILQLGARWAGVEFELRTDAGIFPAPVVVDASGVLCMDLGGSTTYTLSCVESAVPIPDPVPPASAGEDPAQDKQETPETKQPPASPAPGLPRQGIPTTHLVMFLTALAVGIGCLVVFFLSRRRRRMEESEWDEEEEDL